MILTSDMRDFIAVLEANEVEYALVGGFAVNYYGYVRTTQDIDLLIFPSVDNARKINQALADFGFGQAGIPLESFEAEGTAIHLGVEPNRIDLLTTLTGVALEDVFARRSRAVVDDLELDIISFEDLLASKRSSNRPKDLADVDELEKVRAGPPAAES